MNKGLPGFFLPRQSTRTVANTIVPHPSQLVRRAGPAGSPPPEIARCHVRAANGGKPFDSARSTPPAGKKKPTRQRGRSKTAT